MAQGFCGFLLHLGGGRAVVKVLTIWQMLVMGSDESFFCLQIRIKKSKYLTQ